MLKRSEPVDPACPAGPAGALKLTVHKDCVPEPFICVMFTVNAPVSVLYAVISPCIQIVGVVV